jgi:hypothetical protein
VRRLCRLKRVSYVRGDGLPALRLEYKDAWVADKNARAGKRLKLIPDDGLGSWEVQTVGPSR